MDAATPTQAPIVPMVAAGATLGVGGGLLTNRLVEIGRSGLQGGLHAPMSGVGRWIAAGVIGGAILGGALAVSTDAGTTRYDREPGAGRTEVHVRHDGDVSRAHAGAVAGAAVVGAASLCVGRSARFAVLGGIAGAITGGAIGLVGDALG